MTQLYEIRHAETGWKLMKPGTERDVRRFWAANNPTESRTQKISGVIVIYVTFDREQACTTS
ncbi:MAG: hypothetical protein ACM3WS_03585 [Bacillota bacterium]